MVSISRARKMPGGGVTRSLALDAHGKSAPPARSEDRAGFTTTTDPSKQTSDRTMPNTPTLASLADDLENGRTSARKLVDECLARIADSSGEGRRAFLHVDAEAAIEAAEAMDRLREVKVAPSPFAGIPVSIKDLFDIKGQVTRAGSRALEDSAPADADAPAVARLRRAGFIVIGRTNMTEFAYSGIGINPHYGTPRGAWRRDLGHVPGGSSSGAAVSVVDGMAHGALGTDTGGSCRIPAAYNGIVGFKPTQRRIPLDGGVPLSFTLDSFGPLARSVGCCAVLDAVLASKGDVYDPRVSIRILRGEAITAADYIDLLEARKSLIARAAVRLAPYDALVLPTTANTPPRIADLADDKAFTKANLRSLRNCTLINMIDGCAISLPCHREGEVPVGLMVAASAGSDRRIFELAAAMEDAMRV
jgi:Asp-tRNA(Asn)/Glu-tRNA(Gln) amidotransferase A subunit family amidase